MGLDLAKMRAKLQQLESGGKSKKDNVFWKPSEGEQEIRIVPTSDGDPFKVDKSFIDSLLGKLNAVIGDISERLTFC